MPGADVIRRVGDLEDMAKKSKRRKDVIRRVGGLEAYTSRRAAMRPVIRRVGGLEVTVGAFLRLPLT